MVQQLLDNLVLSLQEIRILLCQLFSSGLKIGLFFLLLCQNLLNILCLLLQLPKFHLKLTHFSKIRHLNRLLSHLDFPQWTTGSNRRRFFPLWLVSSEHSTEITWNTIWLTLQTWVCTRLENHRPNLAVLIFFNWFSQVYVLDFLFLPWLRHLFWKLQFWTMIWTSNAFLRYSCVWSLLILRTHLF